VDNLFLETVSKQVDKIGGFEHSDYASMRAYINWSHLMGAVVVLPIVASAPRLAGSRAAVPRAARESFMSFPAFELLAFIFIVN